MIDEKELEKYRDEKTGRIDWEKYYQDNLSSIIDKNNHLSLIINKKREEEKKIIPLQELTVFKLADELSDYIWEIVSKWEWFAKKTVGDQIVRAADSIGANIAEGYGRYFFAEYLVFLYYSRGSVYETWYWAEKARRRKLISQGEYKFIKDRTDRLPLEINKVIKIIKGEKKKWEFRKR